MQSIDEKKLLQEIIRHGFWFVDVPRTGSTSLKRELEVVYGTSYAKKRITSLHDHATAIEARDFLGADTWKGLFTFSMVRNPWARAYSLYQYRLKIAKNIPHTMEFRDYLRDLAKEKRLPKEQQTWYSGYLMSACDYLVDGSGNLLVDFVGKLEDRETFFTTINTRLPIPLLGDVHVMKTSSEEARLEDLYDTESAAIIADLYADDIQRFGYSLQTNPGKPYVPNLSHDDLIAHLKARLDRSEDDLNICRHALEDAEGASRTSSQEFTRAKEQLDSTKEQLDSTIQELASLRKIHEIIGRRLLSLTRDRWTWLGWRLMPWTKPAWRRHPLNPTADHLS